MSDGEHEETRITTGDGPGVPLQAVQAAMSGPVQVDHESDDDSGRNSLDDLRRHPFLLSPVYPLPKSRARTESATRSGGGTAAPEEKAKSPSLHRGSIQGLPPGGKSEISHRVLRRSS